MARAALKWGVRDLARNANVTPTTISRIEAGRPAFQATLEALRIAFEAAGIEFLPEDDDRGAGVRFIKPRG
jgi:transcriptional regulator with XRE-family HTH domain